MDNQPHSAPQPPALSDSKINQTAGESLGSPPNPKQPTTKESVLGCGCLAVIVLLLSLALKSCFFEGGEAQVSEPKRAFSMTAEEFRTAFNNKRPELEIKSFQEEIIEGEPWVSYVFEDGSGLKINLEPNTRRIYTFICAFTKHAAWKRSDSYPLADKAIRVLSPDADSADSWALVDRLTKEADGTDALRGKSELFQNLSVSALFTGQSNSGQPLIMLVFTPRPAETIVEAAKPVPSPATRLGGRFSKLGVDGTIRHGYYRIKAAFPKEWNYVTWEYTLNSDGSIYFIDSNTNHGVLVSQPFAVEEQYAAKGWEPK